MSLPRAKYSTYVGLPGLVHRFTINTVNFGPVDPPWDDIADEKNSPISELMPWVLSKH